METRYKAYQRGNGIYYIQDVVTNQQESLRTRDKKKALALPVRLQPGPSAWQTRLPQSQPVDRKTIFKPGLRSACWPRHVQA